VPGAPAVNAHGFFGSSECSAVTNGTAQQAEVGKGSVATYEGCDCPQAPPHRELNQNQKEFSSALLLPDPGGSGWQPFK